MELIGKLKKKVDKASTKEEKRELIEEAGMKLNDVELEMIAGGTSRSPAKKEKGLLHKK